MDAKALAKSKRAHSQRHSRKRHSNLTPKAVSVGLVEESSAKEPSSKQVGEKSHHSQGSSSLPTNWDRYEEEHGLDSEDLTHNSVSQAIGGAVPKSKGADFVHLISEAKSQSELSLASFPSFDDVLNDFNQEFGSLLSVRGQSILSWAGDDNFVVEDKLATSQEASFLSLNLHLLAEQLANVDLAQRLFIEPDILPSDMCVKESKTNFSQEFDEVQAVCEIEGVKKNSDQLLACSNSEIDKMVDLTSPYIPSGSSGICHSVSTTRGHLTNQIKDERSHSRGTDESSVQYLEQMDDPSIVKPENKSAGFEAAAAEAELDVLLNSFDETNFLDSSSVTKNGSSTFSFQQEKSMSRSEGTLKQAPPQPLNEDSESFRPASQVNSFEDDLDDLLKETSSSAAFSAQQEENTTSMFGGISSVQSAPVQPLKNGPHIANSTTLTDDALDDLLKETSHPTNHSSTFQATAGTVSKFNVLDDFDSWFDTV